MGITDFIYALQYQSTPVLVMPTRPLLPKRTQFLNLESNVEKFS
jgi:hypothetical protein